MDAISVLLYVVPILILVGLVILVLRSSVESALMGKIITVIVISVVLVSSVLIPIINESDDPEAPTISTMVYDDYLQIDNVSSVTGAAELLDIDGKKYLHANAVGDMTVVYNGGLSRTYTVSKADLDVFAIGGQSNSGYYIYDLETASPKVTLGTSYYYGTESKPLVFGPYAAPDYDETFESYSIQPATSSNLAHLDGPFSETYYHATGHKVLTINVGVSGSSITEWQPGERSYLYAQEAFTHALALIDEDLFNVSIKGYLWLQGEADHGMEASTYASYFLNAYTVFEDNGFEECFISQVRNYPSVSWLDTTTIIEAQNSLAEDNEHIHMGTKVTETFFITNGLMRSDNIHYTQLGHNLIGQDLGEYCAAFFYE